MALPITTDPEVIAQLALMPAMEAPKGITANFVDPPNQNGLAVVVIVVTQVIATMCFLLRAYARVYLLHKFQIEEILIACAFVVYCAQTWACVAIISTTGYFIHQWNILLGDVFKTGYYVLLIGSFYQTVLPLLKCAILTEWIRLFAPPGNRIKSPFWWGCVAIMTLQTVWGITCVILLNVQCSPHEKIWKVYLPGKCYVLTPVQYSSGAIQLFSDVIMLLLPQKIIWGLKLSLSKKLGLSALFALGILACISAAFRLSVTVTYGSDPDGMYYLAPVVFWVLAETTCGFFIVCMPCLPKIFKDAGLIRKMKQRLGIKVTTIGASGGQNSNYAKYGFSSKSGTGVSGLSRTGTTADAYHKLDEERGVALGDMKTESTEQLRYPEDAKREIVKTTKVSVQVTDGGSHTDSDVERPPRDNWYR